MRGRLRLFRTLSVRLTLIELVLSTFLLLWLGGCSNIGFIVPNPPGKTDSRDAEKDDPPQKREDKPSKTVEKKEPSTSTSPEDASSEQVDFYTVFSDSPEDSSDAVEFFVPTKKVRIALKRKVDRCVFYTVGSLRILGDGNAAGQVLKGRVVAEARGESARLSSGAASLTVSLPCTLEASTELNYFELHEKNYRGSVILTRESRGTVSLLNYLDVEEYLRGVVPLEIGPRKPEEMAAVMAQAVVARTYTYRRMLDRGDWLYDLLPTVSDQVYGGVSAERQESDRAIRTTSDLILCYNDEPIHAYYHSTCGGMTANIEDVWGKGAQPYLVARPDINEKGEPYCSISTYFEWDETWKTSHLSAILAKYGRSAFPDHQPFRGPIRKLSVGETYACGRVRSCVVHTTGHDYQFGGDKIRFAFRRAISGRPILRSSRFRVENCNGSTVRIRGWGYGHGIGMCQMGAVGRARAGQTCHEILRAYYAEVDEAVVRVDPDN